MEIKLKTVYIPKISEVSPTLRGRYVKTQANLLLPFYKQRYTPLNQSMNCDTLQP